MKIKSRNKRKPIGPNEGQIPYLPEDTADQAKLVQEASDIEAGPTSETVEPTFVNNEGSEALLEAAKLEAPAGDTPPPMTDAEYEEVVNREPDDIPPPISNHELVAAELREANERNADAPLTVDQLFDNEPTPWHVRFSEFCINHIRDANNRLNNLRLMAIAKGNEANDWLTKQVQNLYTWSKAKVAQYEAWREEVRPLRASEFYRTLEQVGTTLLDHGFLDRKPANDSDVVAVLANRLATLEKAVASNSKAISRAIKSSRQVDPDILNKYTLAVTQGKNIQVINLYREITGADLAGAKLAVEAIMPVKEPA